MDTISRDEFVRLVAEAYEHLYDPVFLRSHPLADILLPGKDLPAKERALRLQRLLLDAIEDLDPGPQAPALSFEARRYQLMSLYHAEGLEPQAVADRLGISRRHFYREHDAGIEAVVALLWERHGASPAVEPEPVQTLPPSTDRLDILRLEAARLAQAGRYAHLREVLPGVLSLLQDRLRQRKLVMKANLPDLPAVGLDPGLLRQTLLTTLSYLMERSESATLCLDAQVDGEHVSINVVVDPPDAVRAATASEAQERQQALDDLARLGGVKVDVLQNTGVITAFRLRLPALLQRVILVVDDNEDVLELFNRYLTAHGYRVATANSASAGMALAFEIQPYAITLDLMMPKQDGWDMLQLLLNEPRTQSIPIIVCSVLRARELALSLGATSFLPKPVTEQAILAALQALEHI